MNFPEKRNYLEKTLSLSAIIAIALIAFKAFPTHIARKIKREANGTCAECQQKVGNKNLIASHIFHGVNDRDNGRALCAKCETEYHLSHSTNPERIGLSQEVNDTIVKGRVLALDENDQRELIMAYMHQWNSVIDRINR